MNSTENLWLALIALVVLLVIGALVAAESDEKHKWETFKQEHSCKIVAKIDGETNLIVTSRDIGVTGSSPKTGWLCNDGITYYKEN